MFFVFEGVDGAGKSTQLDQFAHWLESRGHSVVTCQDPGSTQLGEQLRKILLNKHETPIDMLSEMMMFTTARTQLIQQIVKPELAAGKTVVLDRYILSTVVYQGYAGNLNADDIWTVNRIATDGVMPDVTFVFDLDVATALKRVGRSRDRMESRGIEYFERVRTGFLKEAERWPDCVEIIDADRPPEEIQEEIRRLADQYLQRKSPDKT